MQWPEHVITAYNVSIPNSLQTDTILQMLLIYHIQEQTNFVLLAAATTSEGHTPKGHVIWYPWYVFYALYFYFYVLFSDIA